MLLNSNCVRVLVQLNERLSQQLWRERKMEAFIKNLIVLIFNHYLKRRKAFERAKIIGIGFAYLSVIFNGIAALIILKLMLSLPPLFKGTWGATILYGLMIGLYIFFYRNYERQDKFEKMLDDFENKRFRRVDRRLLTVYLIVSLCSIFLAFLVVAVFQK
jgi:hypothetical protein